MIAKTKRGIGLFVGSKSTTLQPRERGYLKMDVADAIEVEVHRYAPAANKVLSPNQLEARIEVYAELAAMRLPLFDDGPPVEEGQDQFRCCGCGRQPPLRDNGARMMPCKVGWVTRRISLANSESVTETWCPECAAMTGFGCVEEEEPAE